MSLVSVTMARHKVLVGRRCSVCSLATGVWQAPAAGLGHSLREAAASPQGAFPEETLKAVIC